MKLTYKNYTAEVEGDRFNLFQHKKIVGYSYTFEGLLRKIAHLEMGEKKDMTIAEYISEFKKVLKDIEGWMNI